MLVFIGCEFSCILTQSFKKKGHDAWSCDYLETEIEGNHFKRNVLSNDIVKQHWDLAIFHPDCTFLTVAGARWMNITWRKEAQLMSLHFVKALWELPIDKICIENPISRLSTLWQKPHQIIQPYQFGHQALKATCFWLKNLEPLQATSDLKPPKDKHERNKWAICHNESPSIYRWKNRSRTLHGIANAMAEQWG